jgi:hypothetical protein
MAAAPASSASAREVASPPPEQAVTMSAAQLFAFADRARDAGDYATAEAAYRALAGNPDIELRTEARFRLGMMLADRLHRYREAAVEFRKILDEKPNAARVRLELARMDALLGNSGAAERELRSDEAAGLPPEVERVVRFYANALSARKPLGGSLELALAPDSNINRATRSDTLGTVIGDFDLDKNARQRSGLGLALKGQAYLRAGAGRKTSFLLRASGYANLYRASQFDDIALSLQAGPEFTSGKDRLALSVGPGWRWYGAQPYSFTLGGSAEWRHPLGKRAQLRLNGAVSRVKNRRNDLQDATDFSVSASLDRAFTARFGGGLQLYGLREAARDAGYSTASGGVETYLFREFGKTTLVASLGYSHLEGDERLLLFPKRRVEDRYSASLAASFRALRVGPFAPLVKVTWERNASTVELYDYRRIAAEFGITSAF